MLILELALTAILATRGTASKAPDVPPRLVVGSNAELVRLIKKDIESIAGPGSVDISVDHDTLFSVRIAVPNFRTEVCNPIYDVELKLYRYFPDLNFDFYLRSKP